MKLSPTAAGDLRIQVEHGVEWLILSSVARDARAGDFDPAASVGARITDEETRADWDEWVEPDLRLGFDQQVEAVARAVSEAQKRGRLRPGEWVVPKADFVTFFGALNQARLALEAKYGLANKLPEEEDADSPERRSAYLRSQFYTFLQSHLLDLGLG
jgi:hypothetical protein